MIVAEPKVIIFDSITPGKLYLLTLSLRNSSTKAQRIRIKAPTSDYFALNYIPTRSVASGLDIRAEIECQLPSDITNSNIGYTDRLIATMGDFTLEIPIIASKPHSVLVHNALVDFGNTSLGSLSQLKLTFENQGTVSGKVSFITKHMSNISIQPSEIELQPNEKCDSIIEFNGDVPIGSYREIIEVKMTNALKPSSVIDVIATIIESKLTIFGPNHDGYLQNIHFGLVYYGHERIATTTIVNSGSIPLHYRIYEDNSNDSDISGDAGSNGSNGTSFNTKDKDDPVTSTKSSFLSISPNENILTPFTEENVYIRFHPHLIKPNKGFTKPFMESIQKPKDTNYRMIFETVETGQKHYFQVSSQVMNPTFHIDRDRLHFGKCPSNDRRDARITVSNHSPTPLEFNSSKHPYFKFTPASGRILQHTSISIIVSFLPLQLGVFQIQSALFITNCPSSSLTITLYGEANEIGPKRTMIGGTDKLPEDFQYTYKFIDQEIEEAKYIKSRNRMIDPTMTQSLELLHRVTTLNSELLMPSTEVDKTLQKLNLATESRKMYGLEDRGAAFDERRKEQMKIQELWEKKKEVDRGYNQYLQSSYKRRVQMSTAATKNKEKYNRMKVMDDIVLDY